MLLRKGSRGKDVKRVQTMLNELGYTVGAADGVYGRITEGAVEQFQTKNKLVADGVVGPKTFEYLVRKSGPDIDIQLPKDTFNQIRTLPFGPPKTAADHRVNDAVKTVMLADGGQGCRYSGWVGSGIELLEKVEELKAFTIPKTGRIDPKFTDYTKPTHGGTCSPFAALFMAWLLCARDFTWRIGRQARWIATWPCAGKKYKGKTHRGFGEYCRIIGEMRWRSGTMGDMYGMWGKLGKVNLVEMTHHVILVLKVGGPDGLNLLDPWTGKPLQAGLYRFAADGQYVKRDGKKYYAGNRYTFRLLGLHEKTYQKWMVYRVADLLDDGTVPEVPGGLYHDLEPYPLVLQ